MNVLNRLRRRRVEADLDSREDRRLQMLEERVAHIESELRGLQDSAHRQFVRQDKRMSELTRQIRPEQIAEALSRDARRRGV